MTTIFRTTSLVVATRAPAEYPALGRNTNRIDMEDETIRIPNDADYGLCGNLYS